MVSGNERQHRDLNIASITKRNKNLKEDCVLKAFFPSVSTDVLKDLISLYNFGWLESKTTYK